MPKKTNPESSKTSTTKTNKTSHNKLAKEPNLEIQEEKTKKKASLKKTEEKENTEKKKQTKNSTKSEDKKKVKKESKSITKTKKETTIKVKKENTKEKKTTKSTHKKKVEKTAEKKEATTKKEKKTDTKSNDKKETKKRTTTKKKESSTKSPKTTSKKKVEKKETKKKGNIKPEKIEKNQKEEQKKNIFKTIRNKISNFYQGYTKKKKKKEKKESSKQKDSKKTDEKETIIIKIKKRISSFCLKCKSFYKSLNTKKNNKMLSRFIIISIFLLLCLQLSNSIYHIITWQKENEEIEEQVEEIEKETIVEEKEEDPEKVEVIKPAEEIKKEDPYWDYIKMKLINVDFKALKKKNNHTVGWIQVNGTNINYPFVQTNNNDFYLNHAFDKSYNTAGWVYMDYRNSISDFDKNTIIYAHGRLDNTMFGSLRYILKNEWIKNTDNYIIKLSTEYENTLWQVFSIYRIPTTSDYLQIQFKDGKAFTAFTDKLIKRSQYNFKTKVGANDKIITLSTCYDDNDKLVLHAKLIKREAR